MISEDSKVDYTFVALTLLLAVAWLGISLYVGRAWGRTIASKEYRYTIQQLQSDNRHLESNRDSTLNWVREYCVK